MGEQFVMFHDNVVASFSTVKMSIKNDALPHENEATMLPQNTGNWYPVIKRHISDEWYQ